MERRCSNTISQEDPDRIVTEDERLSDTPGRENWRLNPPPPHRNLPPPPPLQGYVEKGDKDSLNDEEESGVSNSSDSQPLPNNLLNYINPRAVLETSHSYCFLWIVLSSFYGQLLLILMVTFTLIEVMDNKVKLLSLQGIYLMYLYIGGIVVIICIYIWVLLDSCASFRSDSKSSFKKIVLSDSDLGKYSLTKFGSLKRAHLSRDKTSATSFYLRIGALAFGIGTLVFNGLEMAMHSMMEGPCLNDVVFVHPVLHGLFTFLQMHFLFVNSQVLVERFGLIARFGFMHLAATNLALWVRLIVWESGIEWTYFIFLIRSGNFDQQTLASAYNEDIAAPLRNKHFPRIMTTFLDRKERDVHYRPNETIWAADPYRPISDSHISQVVALHQCLNTNSLGQLWTSSMPFLYPFIVQFSLIAAGVTYVMGQNVGRDRMFKMRPVLRKSGNNNSGGDPEGGVKSSQPNPTVTTSYGRRHIDCTGASKGLFLGLLCLVAAIVVIIIFLVVKDDDGFPIETLFWVMNGTQGLILALSLLITLPGILRIKKLSYTGKHPTTLDSLLSTVTLGGVQLYSVFGIVIGACSAYIATPHSIEQRQHLMLVTVSAVQLIQAGMQSTLIEEGLRRGALTRHQHLTTPGRQVVTFLLCSNVALWAMDSFVTQNWFSQELQLRFMGVLAWGVLSRISLPLLVFYRFHSGILLLEIWQRAYNNNLMDSSNI